MNDPATTIGAILILLTLPLFLLGLWGAIFWRSRRAKSLKFFAAAVLALVGGVAISPPPTGTPATTGGAREASVETSNRAQQAALSTPEMKALIHLVEASAKELPDHFEARDASAQSFQNMMRPLPSDVMGYAKFYWVLDVIEGSCQHLGQRSNIEMLDPSNGVSVWAGLPMSVMIPGADNMPHPNHPDYMEVLETVETAVARGGESVACAEMYRLLGPNGSLMSPLAIDISNLLDPANLDRWVVRPEDGVLWSSRDYCEREYFLKPPEDRAMHDLMCAKANEQPF